MRDHPDFKPTDIVKEVFNKYGVSISYWTAWRSRWLMLEAMHGNYEEGYRLVPELCRQILKRNPGSIAKHFVSDGTKSFIGVAVAFKSSIDGWLNGCRPIVGLDGCFLKGKYGGCCLTAIGLDAMNGIFPLAVYVCQGENKDTWMQLLCHLKPHLDKHKDKVSFMSDASINNKSGKRYNVDLGKFECSCIEWQMSGIPCAHAVAVIRKKRVEKWSRYCSPYFSVEAFRRTYANYLYPLENIEDWEEIDEPEELVLPPEVASKVGRPRKQRIRGDDEPPKTRRKCTKCGELGHNPITCDQRQKGIYGKKKRKGVPGQEEPTEAPKQAAEEEDQEAPMQSKEPMKDHRSPQSKAAKIKDQLKEDHQKEVE
ncbi:hypothetical protein IFM89_013474 [Coptis chinensis]|uniref:SWIM-type domain-containing protein n=1 Tax=Coptis chinensis TaxID=261450 RepID=A0A835IBT9_9MAGN|nr:hypothetical protein IFM89_013474 [Coptis chinensis]